MAHFLLTSFIRIISIGTSIQKDLRTRLDTGPKPRSLAELCYSNMVNLMLR